MKLNFKDKICPNCKTENNFICEENQTLSLSLKSYKALKNKPVFKCEHCGFCSYTFEEELEEETLDFVNGEIYADILEYGELNGLERLDLNIIESYNAYDYECASLVHALEEEFNYAFIALFKAIQLKDVIKEKYYLQMLADKEELTQTEIKEYEIIVNILEQKIASNFKNLIDVFNNTDKNIFQKLLMVEAVNITGNKTKALKMFNQLKTETNLPSDLVDYFNSLLAN